VLEPIVTRPAVALVAAKSSPLTAATVVN